MHTPSVRIVYMGTPGFAVMPLKALLDEGFEIAAVITSPDKPAGRGKKLLSPEVKLFAESKGLRVLQPEKLRDPSFLAELQSIKPDLQVVVAFRMLPKEVWSLPNLGTFNLHASLLPQYRGAAPINHVLINGETETGVTTFLIDEQIDTGKILFREKVMIPETYTAGDLHDLLMEKGASLVIKTVNAIVSGNWKETPQDQLVKPGEILRQAPKIYREDCEINWNSDGKKIHDFIRGLSPVPSAYSCLSGPSGEAIQVKIFLSSFIPGNHGFETGTLVNPDKRTLMVAVKDGYISLLSLQVAGKNKVNAASFLNGFRDIEKYRLISQRFQ